MLMVIFIGSLLSILLIVTLIVQLFKYAFGDEPELFGED